MITADGMKSVGLRCSDLSKYHNVFNGLKCSINHGYPTVLYRVLYAVFIYFKIIFTFLIEIVCRIKKNDYICIIIITQKNTTMKTVEQIKSELTNKEVKSFETLVRLGDSIQLAYETVLNERTKEDATEFYRNAYEN